MMKKIKKKMGDASYYMIGKRKASDTRCNVDPLLPYIETKTAKHILQMKAVLKCILSGNMDQLCALCLSEESLLSPLHVCTLQDQYSDVKLSVQELLDHLSMEDIFGGPATIKICSPCVESMSSFYLFKSKCTKITSSFKNFLNAVHRETSQLTEKLLTSRSKRSKKVTIKLSYDNIMQYVTPKKLTDIKEKKCNELAKTISQNGDILPFSGYECNICNIKFASYNSTVDHFAQHEHAELDVEGIRVRGIDIFECKICGEKTPWDEYVGHEEMHCCERVTRMIVENKMFCCCCLGEADNLVDMKRETSNLKSEMWKAETVSLETLLSKVLNVETINRFGPLLVCERCIDGTIQAHMFQEIYDKSTKILTTCLEKLNQSLLTEFNIEDEHENKLIVQIEFENLKSANQPSSPDFSPPPSPFSPKGPVDYDQFIDILADKEEESQAKTVIYGCARCDEYFTTLRSFWKHRKDHKPSPFLCRICDARFLRMKELNVHEQITHPEEAYCFACRRVFQKDQIEDHIQAEHKVNTLVCNLCSTKCRERAKLIRHIKNRHQKNIKSVTQMNLHKYRCTECRKKPCVHNKYLTALRKAVEKKSILKCINCKLRWQVDLHNVGEVKRKIIEHANKKHLHNFPYACPQCDVKSASKILLRGHLRRHRLSLKRMSIPTLQCEVCEFSSRSKYNFEKHKKSHPICGECKKSYLKGSLQSHVCCVYSSDQGKSIESSVSSAAAPNGVATEKTYGQDKKFICDMCGKVLLTKLGVEFHISSHLPRVKCKYCTSKMKRARMPMHLRTKHGKVEHRSGKTERENKPTFNGRKQYMCDLCGFLTDKPHALHSHRLTHKKKEKCPECIRFVKKESLPRHMAKYHSEVSRQQMHIKNGRIAFSKNENGRTITVYRTLLNCDDCDFKTINRQRLTGHIYRNHLKIKPHMCTLCDKRFYRIEALAKHVANHSVPTSECDVCKKVFKTPVGYKLHMRQHTGERPYECSVCGDKFISLSRMKEHKLKRHSSPTVPCPQCGKLFFYQRYVDKHIKQVHQKEKRVQKKYPKKNHNLFLIKNLIS